MPTPKKSSSKSTGAKKPQVKVRDMKPSKDAKAGGPWKKPINYQY